MNAFKHTLAAIATVAVLASAATFMTPLDSAAEETDVKMPSTAADHAAEARELAKAHLMMAQSG